jgi:hypothetical protein
MRGHGDNFGAEVGKSQQFVHPCKASVAHASPGLGGRSSAKATHLAPYAGPCASPPVSSAVSHSRVPNSSAW